ncbi:hypothetical protein EON66_12250, partial [archaeon]
MIRCAWLPAGLGGCSTLGLVLVCYKTAKQLKTRVDLAMNVVEDEMQPNTRSIATRRQSTRPPPDGAPHVDAEPDVSPTSAALCDTDLRMEHLLKFWVMFGFMHTFTAYDVPYSHELRAFLVLIAALPSVFGATWIEAVFARVASPFVGVVCHPLIQYLRRLLGTILAVLA